MAKDPVCKMTVSDTAKKSVFEGAQYYFCSDACRKAFDKNPKKFIV